VRLRGLLRLLLCPLLPHADAALRQEDMPGALHEEKAFNDELGVLQKWR
jgi:hypothetical protein